MEVNAIFNIVKVYKVQDILDIVLGTDLELELTGEVPTDLKIFTDNDPVLNLDGKKIKVETLGSSLIRFMSGAAVVKDIYINAVDATHPNATALNGNLGEPISK